MAPAGTALTKPPRITRRIILQKARGHPLEGSHGMEAHDFRVYFTPLAGVLFTVPSRYCALSVVTCSVPWAVVRPASDQVPRAWPYLGACDVGWAPPTRLSRSTATYSKRLWGALKHTEPSGRKALHVLQPH